MICVLFDTCTLQLHMYLVGHQNCFLHGLRRIKHREQQRKRQAVKVFLTCIVGGRVDHALSLSPVQTYHEDNYNKVRNWATENMVMNSRCSVWLKGLQKVHVFSQSSAAVRGKKYTSVSEQENTVAHSWSLLCSHKNNDVT